LGKKLDRVYHAIIEGASKGLYGDELYRYVIDVYPKASSKRIVRASLLALTDPDVTDRNVLSVVYALAIKHRMISLGADEDQHEDDEEGPSTASVAAKKKKKLGTSAADIPSSHT